MNNFIHKIISLILIILITLLVLDYFTFITFSKVLKDCLYFSTTILIVFSSTSVVASNTKGLNKFINYLIIICIFIGLLLFILKGELNVVVYSAILLTVVYSLMDMLYKKS
ncbi:MAG: hypothetical protein GX275_04280 [Clostridiales bacterium]|nr:hypothetical protein [Clostridiales bacterium]